MKNNFEDLAKFMQEMEKKYPEIVEQETEDVMWLIVNLLESAVIDGTPAGVGGAAGLRGSIFGEVVTIGSGIRGIIGTPVEYAEVVELGRRPGKQPPPGALLSWVEKKLGYSSTEAKSIEYLISRKIGKKGTAGKFMFKNAWEKSSDQVYALLNTIPDRVRRKIGA